MRQSLSSRIEDVLVKKGELCSAEIVEVGSRDVQVTLEANELDDLQVCAHAQSPHTMTREVEGNPSHLFRRFVLSQELMSSLEPETGDAVEVVAPAQDGHVPKLCVGPAGEVVFPTFRKIVAADERAQTFAVELENDVPAAEDEQVRVFGDDRIDVAALFEVCELRICFVRRNNILRSRSDVSAIRVPPGWLA